MREMDNEEKKGVKSGMKKIQKINRQKSEMYSKVKSLQILSFLEEDENESDRR